jgi:hypothetical protein
MNLSLQFWTLLSGKPFAVASAAIACAAVLAVRSGNRPRRVVATVLGVLGSGLFLVLQLVDRQFWWLWAASMLAPAMILNHAIHVALFKNRGFFEDGGRVPVLVDNATLRPIMRAARSQEERYYSSAGLMLRFGVPAIILAVTTLTVGYALIVSANYITWPSVGAHVAAKYGALGAYLYMMLYLGNRTFRGDVTTGAAIWSSVTIVVGPVFAGVLYILFKGGTNAAPSQWSDSLLPFAAGFSPRYISRFVEAGIRRAFGSAAEAVARTTPLLQIRGITRDIEDRLAEEGVTDVAALAMANPQRLRRNTGFDKRQITSWVDEAILMTYLPAGWQALQADGVTGAIDLIWYGMARAARMPPPVSPFDGVQVGEVTPDADGAPDGKAVEPLADADAVPDSVKKLAERNKLDERSLWDTILRMGQDSQVRLVWALYQLDESESESEGGDAPGEFGKFYPENLALSSRIKGAFTGSAEQSGDWEAHRDESYKRVRGLFLVDTSRPSAQRRTGNDVIIRLYQHEHGPLGEGKVKNVEYYLGQKFFKGPIVKSDPKDSFTVAVSADESFLCIARVNFNDETPPMDLQRFVYFSAGAVASAA